MLFKKQQNMLYNIAYFKMKKAFIYKLLKLSKDSLKDLSK